MTIAPALPGVEIWRGGVNTWDCDEMGHMNVRFYVTRAMEGLAGLAAQMGLPHAFAPHANATLVVREHHIRFLKEAHAGAPLHMLGGVIEIGDTEARLLQLLVHTATGELAATFQTTVAHVTPREGEPFAWSRIVRERGEALKVEVPEQARARSVDLSPVAPQASLDRADALGLTRIGLGVLGPGQCDAFGRMAAEQFIGRVSDGVGAFIAPLRDIVARGAGLPAEQAGGAVLEYRVVYGAWPRLGDRLEIRSGLIAAEGRVLRCAHWLLDPTTGAAWASSTVSAATFDLAARKTVAITPQAAAELARHAVPGLGL